MKKRCYPVLYATLAQLDRALGYELRGQEFESLRSHQYADVTQW